jgi:NADPH:quinone reductase-like Zn-dependent oxidoreductase
VKAAVLHALGQTPQYRDFADPAPAAGEVLIEVSCSALKPIDRQLAAGTHFASPRQLPCVCGTDGVGRLSDGQRVFFGGCRAPYGAMAERTVAPAAFAFPLPDELSDEAAAALPNPGVSAWLSLSHRAGLKPGDNVLILGATGVTGKLAITIAKMLGAGRVVAAGRNRKSLSALRELGADATIHFDAPDEEVAEAYVREGGDSGFQVVIDYVWGQPAEAFLSAISRTDFAVISSDTRYVQAGESAGPEISLSAATLRSTGIKIMGTGGIPPLELLADSMRKVLAHGARGELRVDTDRVPLADIESAWTRVQSGRRLVIAP